MKFPHPLSDTLFPKRRAFFHACKVYILYPYDVILPHKAYRHLVQEVVTLVLGFRMQLCDLPALLPVVLGAFLHMGKSALFTSDLLFQFPVCL